MTLKPTHHIDHTIPVASKPAMRAKPIAVPTINNYTNCSSNNEGYEADEVIVLENASTAVCFSKLGNERMSSELYHRNVVDDTDTKFKQRRRIKTCNRGKKTIVIVIMSCLFSATALALVGALIFGFIEPKSSQKLNGCPCASSETTSKYSGSYPANTRVKFRESEENCCMTAIYQTKPIQI